MQVEILVSIKISIDVLSSLITENYLMRVRYRLSIKILRN